MATIVFGQYELEECVMDDEDVRRPSEHEVPQFFGVYFRPTHGVLQWVADFNNKDDAVKFAAFKGQN